MSEIPYRRDRSGLPVAPGIGRTRCEAVDRR